MKKYSIFLTMGALALAGAAGCIAGDDLGDQQIDLLTCYQAPVADVLQGPIANGDTCISPDQLSETGIYCAAERPAFAIGDALLPVVVDRASRTLELEGGLDVNSEAVVVRIVGLEPGIWTEHKRVYNLSDVAWDGWLVAMGNAALVTPDSAVDNVWTDVGADVAEAVYPPQFGASVNRAENAVYFGTTLGPPSDGAHLIQPGDYIEKVWQFEVQAVDGRPTGDALMSHSKRATSG